jgi:DNA-binding transcriptional MocR family regulator
MNPQDAAAAAIQPQQAAPPPPQGAAPQQQAQGAPPLRAVAEAYARCEQTGQCTPQDLQILESGLPNLVQMTQSIMQLVQQAKGGGGQPQPR